MCGIIGYVGNLDAKKVLIQGLECLEYRGYDSAGIAVFNEKEKDCIELIKSAGKVNVLKEASNAQDILSHCGIGHTRWATHGEVSQKNSHPHRVGKTTLIHNGIIENYQEILNNYKFPEPVVSDTDTEVAAKLLNYLYLENTGEPFKAISRLVSIIEGSYAFCIMFSDRPGEIYAIRSVSPLVGAYTASGAVIASDLTALIPYSNTYTIIPEHHLICLTKDFMKIYDLTGKEIIIPESEITWSIEAAQKNGFPYFMLKEIHEQPEAVLHTIRPRIVDGIPCFLEDKIPDSIFKNCDKIQIVACGTAMHAGMVARALIEPLLRIPVTVSIASEFRYEKPLLDENTLVIIISQSGETIDTLAALHLAKSFRAKTLAVVNVKGSTIARESDYVFYTHAGPEIAVASTKAYSVQLAALYLIGCRMALVRGRYTQEQGKDFISHLEQAVPAIQQMLTQCDKIEKIIPAIISQKDAFFIGRGLDYAYSLEGALKLKEISYIHAEAYAAGELKHGTIALIEKDVPVIALATQNSIFAKTISNIREVKARGAFVILITKESAKVSENVCDIWLTIPDLEDKFTVFPLAVLLQFIAYYASVSKGLSVDQPRNLAKSVTVE